MLILVQKFSLSEMMKSTETDKTLIRLAKRFRQSFDFQSDSTVQCVFASGDFVYDFFFEEFDWSVLRTFVLDERRKRYFSVVEIKMDLDSKRIIGICGDGKPQFPLAKGQVHFVRERLISLWIREHRLKLFKKIVHRNLDTILNRLWKPDGPMCKRQWQKIQAMALNWKK